MTPSATLVHHIDGRTRFRVAEKRGDREYFARVSEKLEHCPGVFSVTVSEVTGSVLVFHEPIEVGVLASYARTFELFDSAEAGTEARMITRPPAEIVGHRLGQLDGWVRAQTGRSTDLRSVALTGLLSAALWQMLRGQILPEAVTLVWYALAMVSNGRRDGGGHSDHAAPAPQLATKNEQEAVASTGD